MAETNYEVELLSKENSKIFKGVYNDFKAKAISEYKFELEPLDFESFVKNSSKIASEIWSQTLSGCPSVTDSDVNKKFLSAI